MGSRIRRSRVSPIRRNNVCTERIIKPLPGLAYYVNENTGVLEQAADLALDDILFLSSNIENSDSVAIRLNDGVYHISFSAIAVPAENGVVSLSIFLNGNPTNIESAQTAAQNSENALSATGIVVAVTDNTFISLRNSGVSSAFLSVNLVIQRI